MGADESVVSSCAPRRGSATNHRQEADGATTAPMTPEASTAPHVPNFGLSQQQQPNVTRPPTRPNSLTRIAATMAGHRQSHEPVSFSAAAVGAGAGTDVCDSEGAFGLAWPCTPDRENCVTSSSAAPLSVLEFLRIRRDSECKYFSAPPTFASLSGLPVRG